MIQKRAFSINSNNSKFLCFAVVLVLSLSTILVSSVLSKENNYLSSYSYVYKGDDANILLSENIADNSYTIDLEFLVSDYNSESITYDSESYLSLSLGDSSTYINDVGKPNLPTIRKLIAIPYGSSYSIKILNSKYETINLDNKKIIPFQQKTYDSKNIFTDNDLIINNEAYLKNDFYPKNIVNVVDKGILRDFEIILLQINPFKYNPVKNEIKFSDKINIRLEFDKKPIRIKQSRFLEDIYDGIILNYDSAKNWPVYKNSKLSNPYGYDFLIITDGDFYDSLVSLKDFKEQRGIETKIVKTSETGTSSTDIKNYIKDAYNNEEISYVLLVGDVEHIPIKDTGDHYYACLEGNDPYPEISIGRFSVKTSEDVDKIVAKTLDYEGFSSNYGYEKNILFTEGSEQHALPVKNYIAENVVPSEMNLKKVYPSQGGTKQQIINYMNEGQLIVNYLGHGSPTEWCGPKLYASDLTGLNNAGKLPIIFSMSCSNGRIDSECMAEESHRDESSCVVYFASTRSCLIKETNEFDKDLFRAIYDHEITVIGDVIFHAKSNLLGEYPNNNEVQMYVLLGDPTLEIKGPGPRLSFNPSSHDFGDKYKKESDSTSFEICNSGEETLTYTLSSDCEWLSISKVEDSLEKNDCDTIDVDIDTTGLDYGDYTCGINIKSNDKNGVFEVSVNVVSHPPDEPSGPVPEDGASGVDVNCVLSVDVRDSDDDSLSVSFFDAGDDSLIDVVNGVESGDTASVEWDGLEYNSEYSWYAIADDGVFETQSEIFSFTTNSPPVFSDLLPEDDAMDISFGIDNLSVMIVDPDGDSFDWSISSNPDIGSISSSMDSDGVKVCNVTGLQPDTEYRWTVSAIDSRGASSESVFSFKTKVNSAPEIPVVVSPMDAGVDVGIADCFLNWSCMDPDFGDVLTYDVYFGKSSNPTLVESGVMDSYYVVSFDLDLDCTYYWKVVANDIFGASVESDVWSFTTSPIPPPPEDVSISFPRRLYWSGVKFSVMNEGFRAASNVKWQVSVKGGVFDRVNVSKIGIVDILNCSESVDVSTFGLFDFKSRVFGFGKIAVEVLVSDVNGLPVGFDSVEGRVFGPIVWLILD